MLEITAGSYVPAPILDTAVSIKVSGVVARVQLQQRFRNQTEHWVEAVYAFPLPEDAAVNRLRMEVGNRVIHGTIAERADALQRYEKARSEGKKASLVEQHTPHLFRNRVANIAPGEEVLVELEYVQQVQWRRGSYSLRFPMTMTPRYVPAGVSAEVAAPEPAFVAAAQLTEGDSHKLRITVDIDMGVPLTAVSARFHPLALTRTGHRYHLSLAQGDTSLDRDLVLDWQPQLGSLPEALLLTGERNAQHYGLLMVLPPESPAPKQQQREIVFVIDTSGSMGGRSIAQARAALQQALSGLAEPHAFNIIEFNSSARQLFPKARPATPHNVAVASEFVRHLEAGGGTEMLGALELALPGIASEHIRQVVFITDGAVANTTQLIGFISENLAGSRLFTVGIGSAPNGWFMRKAAQFGRGSFTYIGDSAEVEPVLASLFEQLEQPQLTDIKVHWPQGVEAYPEQLPDLYAGEPLQLLVRFEAPLHDGVVVVTGQSSHGVWQRQLILGNNKDGTDIATLWARRKIAGLMDLGVLGASDEAVRSMVLPVALEHQLMSPYTSFVAIEERISRPMDAALKGARIPNLLPHGQQMAWPKTALGVLERLLWTGLIAMMIAILGARLWLKRRCTQGYSRQ
ncbi:marine proteobacterial sortase target protein [Candidatus Litorirhabdus singularis]|nr:marine proteobacterial sortase target protein [Candidatus Litorirhabdus singularis]